MGKISYATTNSLATSFHSPSRATFLPSAFSSLENALAPIPLPCTLFLAPKKDRLTTARATLVIDVSLFPDPTRATCAQSNLQRLSLTRLSRSLHC